jgi:hypothetical protein
MKTLKGALLINALFSGISGILLILFYPSLAKIFEVENQTIFWVVGLLLVYFSGTILFEVKKQRKIAVAWIIIQDFVWVIGSLIILVFRPFSISENGEYIIVLIAIIVLFMGINQWKNFKIKGK